MYWRHLWYKSKAKTKYTFIRFYRYTSAKLNPQDETESRVGHSATSIESSCVAVAACYVIKEYDKEHQKLGPASQSSTIVLPVHTPVPGHPSNCESFSALEKMP